MQARDIAPHEILLPVRAAFIIFTFIAALLINLLPWSGWWLVIKPDFVALVVLYWCIQQPRKVGFTSAWLLGLVMDVAEGSLFGQHALAYSVLAFGGIVLHRRVLMFTMRDQVLHVLVLLLLNDLMVLAVRMLAGAAFPGFSYFIGSLAAAALWPALTLLFKLPQRPAPDPDRV
ncbi:MAG: rod shape-determining protein MreD [Betaproteobacteria bacterium]|nr:rod shape-determining protein MreD [Betaproteobacteria bacterium]